MLYVTFVTLISSFSLFSVALVLGQQYLIWKRGIEGSTDVINRLAGKRAAVALQIYSYVSLGAWVALVLPWVDLQTFQWFTSFRDGGIETYFGWMSGRAGSIYFLVVLLNILGVKGAMMVAELAGLLRRGRVMMIRFGILRVFVPEPETSI